MSKKTPSTLYNGMRVVAIPMQKGGVGKTTISMLLANYASEGFFPSIKKRVLAMDFDDQQNFSQALLEMESIPGFDALLPPIHPAYDPMDPEDIEWGGRSNSVDLYYGNPVLPYPTNQSDKLDILPSDGAQIKSFEDLQKAADQTLLEKIAEEMANWMREPDVQEMYDLIVMDCPPGKTMITTPILRACTDVVIPVEMENFGVSGFNKLMRQIETENENREIPINVTAIVPNKYDARMSLHRAHWAAIKNLEDYKDAIIKHPMKALADYKTARLPVNVSSGEILKRGTDAFRNWMDIIDHISKRMYGEGIKIPRVPKTKTKKEVTA